MYKEEPTTLWIHILQKFREKNQHINELNFKTRAARSFKQVNNQNSRVFRRKTMCSVLQSQTEK